jgi:hypothetical protein
VQAAGEPADFHCVALARPLQADAALGPGGHPRHQPAGPPPAMLAQAAPRLDEVAFPDESADQPENLYDAFWSGSGVAIKAGVRLRVDATGAEPSDSPPYLYVIRVNFDLVRDAP